MDDYILQNPSIFWFNSNKSSYYINSFFTKAFNNTDVHAVHFVQDEINIIHLSSNHNWDVIRMYIWGFEILINYKPHVPENTMRYCVFMKSNMLMSGIFI